MVTNPDAIEKRAWRKSAGLVPRSRIWKVIAIDREGPVGKIAQGGYLFPFLFRVAKIVRKARTRISIYSSYCRHSAKNSQEPNEAPKQAVIAHPMLAAFRGNEGEHF